MTHHNGVLQFATGTTEAVEQVVLPHAVYPLSPGGQGTAHKVTALSLTGAEATHYLWKEREGGRRVW